MSTQGDLFGYEERPDFGGKTYDRKRDHKRLCTQYDEVFNLMSDGEWRTYGEVKEQTGTKMMETSISARFRDFRKPQFGGHTVNKRIRAGTKALWEFQLIVREDSTVY